jgi:hypothetical protein
MPSWIEFRLAVQGLLRLARFRPDFARFFDRSPAGALRSFWLAVPLFPYSLLAVLNSGLAVHADSMAQFSVVMLMGYVYLWLLPPAIMTWVAPMIGRQADLPGCITMYNWLSLLNVGVGLPLLLLDFVGMPPDVSVALDYSLLVVQLVWEAFLLMHALRLALWQAGLATAIDFLVMHKIVIPLFVLASGAVPASS